MKSKKLIFLFSILLSMVGTKAFAYDIEVKNADGVTFYYNYINDGKELEVTSGNYSYSGSVVIPDEVTYMNRKRKVTSISFQAFYWDEELTSVTIPNSVVSIGEQAFSICSRLTSIKIGNGVTSIGKEAFYHCYSLTSVTIPNSVTDIGSSAFYYCRSMTSVTIPNSVKSIGSWAFDDCTSLTSVNITDIAAWCKISFTELTSNPLFYAHRLFLNGEEIKDLVIPNSVTSIGDWAFYGCSGLTSVTIPNSVTSIGGNAFYGCSGLTSVNIPNGVTSIGNYAFQNCSSLTSVTIPNSVTSIGGNAFQQCDIQVVISKIENPFKIETYVFSNNTFLNATLYVPKGTIDKYKATDGWKKFVYIEEGTGGSNTPTESKKCEKPTISYSNGKLTFNNSTEGATCQYTITDSDIKSGSSNEVQLGVTYNIIVYATKSGYEDSETATATLCWIEKEPKTEGITNGVANVRAMPVMIQSQGGVINITGAPEGSVINVYDLSGKMVDSAISYSETTSIPTNLKSGEIGIIKIGDKSIKVVMQ